MYLIFWGSWWKSPGGKAGAAKSTLVRLFSEVGSSGWARTVTQYCDGSGDSPLSPTLVGSTVDPSNPSAKPTEQDYTKVAGQYSPNQIKGEFLGIPLIITPPGVYSAYDQRYGACAHHNWGSYTPPNDPGLTEYLPWAEVGYAAASGVGCNTAKGVLAGLTINAGHEWAEAVTNPFVIDSADTAIPAAGVENAWINDNGEEIGDLCEATLVDFLQPVFHGNLFQLKLSSGTFWMQKLWSNEANGGRGGCVTGS